MTATSEVQLLWDAHRRAPFPPELAGEEIAGVDLVMLDADIAGCVSTWLRDRGRLDEERRRSLASCLQDVERVLPLLEHQEAHAYYERLRRLTQLIVD